MRHITRRGRETQQTRWDPVQVSTDLSQAAAPAQGAAGLAEVVVVPERRGGDDAPDVVQVVQAAVIGELSERWKTARKKRG